MIRETGTFSSIGKDFIFATMGDACHAVGINPKEGKAGFVVTGLVGKRGSTAGRIKFFSDGKGGMAFNYVAGTKAVWFNDYNRTEPLSKAELKKLQAEAIKREKEEEAKQRERWGEASQLAVRLVEASIEASPQNQYLKAKHIACAFKHLREINKHTAQRLIDEARLNHDDGQSQSVLSMAGEYLLLLPLVDSSRTVVSVQFIDARGCKKFLKGGRIKGAIWAGLADIGESDFMGEVGLCEGMATAVSLMLNYHFPVIAGLSAGNLREALGTVIKLFPRAEYSVYADDDESGAGVEGAKTAVRASYRKISIFKPPFKARDIELFKQITGKDTRPTDFNDYFTIKGFSE